jgi:hypothetical protein
MALVVVAAMTVGLGGAASASAKTFDATGRDGYAFVLKGQTLRVKLPAQNSGSTGYSWRAHGRQKPELRLQSHRTSSDGGSQVFAYRVLRAGVAGLRFNYVSPGRKVRVARRFKLGVYVNNRWRAPGCHPKGARTVAENSKVRVFTLQRRVYSPVSDEPTPFTGYFGCVLGGRAFGFDGADSNDPEKSIPFANVYSHVTLRGTKFGHAFSTDGTVLHPAADGYYVARTIDIGEGRVVRAAYPAQGGPGWNNPIEDLVMSDTGGLAWTEASREGTIVARSDEPATRAGGVAGDRTVIDDGQSGTVDPTSLTLDGGDVTWLRGSQVQRAPLH